MTIVTDVASEVIHRVTDGLFKVGGTVSLALSFVESHVALFTLGITVLAAAGRWYYDRKAFRLKEEVYRAQLARLESTDRIGG